MTAETMINTTVILQQTELMFNQPRAAQRLGSAVTVLWGTIETKQRKDKMVGGLVMVGGGTKVVLVDKIGRFVKEIREQYGGTGI